MRPAGPQRQAIRHIRHVRHVHHVHELVSARCKLHAGSTPNHAALDEEVA